MAAYSVLYFTARDATEARRIGSALVRERLVACVNILPEIESVFRWKGKLEKSREAAAIAKIKSSSANNIIRKVKGLHSYEVPCLTRKASKFRLEQAG